MVFSACFIEGTNYELVKTNPVWEDCWSELGLLMECSSDFTECHIFCPTVDVEALILVEERSVRAPSHHIIQLLLWS